MITKIRSWLIGLSPENAYGSLISLTKAKRRQGIILPWFNRILRNLRKDRDPSGSGR